MKHIALLNLFSTALFASGVVVPDDYLISSDNALSYVYPQAYQKIIPSLKHYQQSIIKGYEKEYGFKLDDTLYVGLASSNNQIVNGFSTQFPFNSQLFYPAGAPYLDYFSSTSWLKTLTIHETAHNFQINPKENRLSRLSHKILGNNPLSFVSFVPLFPVPNITESSFVLEGNAVLNESLYGNGGRLFSGYALCEVIALAKAGEITPALMYNNTLRFPYGEKHYLVGGFFQRFLVKKFGLKKVNGYFKTYATQSLPLFTNAMFEKQYGQDFESLLAEFVRELKSEHAGFSVSQGKELAQSQIHTPLNDQGDEIFTLIGDLKSAHKILKLNKQTKEVSYQEGSWRAGEVIKHKGEYYTQTSTRTSPTKITMGLHDSDAYILGGTQSQAVQGYTRRGQRVSIDIAKSLENPHVYVDGKFYTQCHSSVYIHGNDLFYFKQQGEKRTLYKNRTPLYHYQGHYGIVTDVDAQGNIYFIASSKHGSSVYTLVNGQIKRLLEGDDIIAFKKLNDQEALITTIDAQGYSYKLTELTPAKESRQAPHYLTLPRHKHPSAQSQSFKHTLNHALLPAKAYHPLAELRFSSLDQSLVYTEDQELRVNLQANFADPLSQNSLSAMFQYEKYTKVIGLSYANNAHQLEFGGAVYGEFIEDEESNYGIDAYMTLPFLAKGYWRGSSTLSYIKPYDKEDRAPLTLSMDISNHKQYGFSKYPNHLNALSLFAAKERESTLLGGAYAWSHDFIGQSYIGFKATHLYSDKVDPSQEMGIQIGDTFASLQSDRASLYIPTLEEAYVKEAKMIEVNFKTVFDGSLYSYSFPLSLQREALYLKHRRYQIDFDENVQKRYSESTIGLEFDLLFMHKATIPIHLEYTYNHDIEDSDVFRVNFLHKF